YSTAFNWGRATIGTVPVAWLGAQWGGVEGSMVGVMLGSIVFGLAGAWTAFRAIRTLELRAVS
ncbi:MAG: MATE family efflux transporter, partial [Rhabdaerophilum sp.]